MEIREATDYDFADPTPSEMTHLRMQDMSSVDIDWKMLTNARPRSKADSEFYTKLLRLDQSKVRMNWSFNLFDTTPAIISFQTFLMKGRDQEDGGQGENTEEGGP